MDLGTFRAVQLFIMLPPTVQGPSAEQLAAGWTPRLLATLDWSATSTFTYSDGEYV